MVSLLCWILSWIMHALNKKGYQNFGSLASCFLGITGVISLSF